jgi:FixJ family two-component response regulator
MKAGAVDFLEKPVQPGTLSEAVANALAQDAEFRKVHEQTQRQTARRAEIQRRYKTLTRREQEILHLLLKQKSIKQIAHALGTSPHTVRNQHAAICEKMQAQSDMELLAMMHLVERVASDLAAVPAPELHLPWWPSKSPRP